VLDDGATRAALIAADQGGLGEAVWTAASKQIAAELNCPVANIVMSATHTHSGGMPNFGRGGPPRGGMPEANPNQPPPPIVAQILEAVRQAKSKLQPARVGYGKGFSYLNVNRDVVDPETHRWTQAPNLDAPSDKTVAVIKFASPAGDPIAVYMTYAMHPVNGYLAGFTSADFAGATSRYVEQAYDDKIVAVFAQGASGRSEPPISARRHQRYGVAQRREDHRQRAHARSGRGADTRRKSSRRTARSQGSRCPRARDGCRRRNSG
jgi:neutral ceramidase